LEEFALLKKKKKYKNIKEMEVVFFGGRIWLVNPPLKKT
jgi:hypothetical protein